MRGEDDFGCGRSSRDKRSIQVFKNQKVKLGKRRRKEEEQSERELMTKVLQQVVAGSRDRGDGALYVVAMAEREGMEEMQQQSTRDF